MNGPSVAKPLQNNHIKHGKVVVLGYLLRTAQDSRADRKRSYFERGCEIKWFDM